VDAHRPSWTPLGANRKSVFVQATSSTRALNEAIKGSGVGI